MEYKFDKGAISTMPLGFIYELVNKFHNDIDEIEFSKYVSGGQGITLSREILKLSKTNLLQSINEKMLTLKSDEELAIHSIIYRQKKQFCIPIIDFSFPVLNEVSTKLCQRVYDHFKAPLFLYHSGHSYHGYILKIIKPKQWYTFLGMLLLLNSPKHPYENIDSRWIGHSLENGFSALRLTLNSQFYFKRPEFVMKIG